MVATGRIGLDTPATTPTILCQASAINCRRSSTSKIESELPSVFDSDRSATPRGQDHGCFGGANFEGSFVARRRYIRGIDSAAFPQMGHTFGSGVAEISDPTMLEMMIGCPHSTQNAVSSRGRGGLAA